MSIPVTRVSNVMGASLCLIYYLTLPLLAPLISCSNRNDGEKKVLRDAEVVAVSRTFQINLVIRSQSL